MKKGPRFQPGVVAVIFAAALITVGTLVLWVFQSSAVSARSGRSIDFDWMPVQSET